MRSSLIGILVSASALGATACQNSQVTNADDVIFPDSLVSYNRHVDPFLSISCGQCHGPTNPAGGIDLTSYSGLLFDRPNLVVPGKPDESLLIQVLEGVFAHPVGDLTRIPSNHVQGTRTWIAEGAQNN